MASVPERSRWVASTNSRPLFVALGITGDDVAEGFARYRVDPMEGGDGVVDTLAITTAADQCLVTAASTLIEQGREEMNGTAEMNITYVAEPQGAVMVEGTVLHRGSHLTVITVEAKDEAGAVVAAGRGSYAIRPLNSSQGTSGAGA
jgi:acyl-coenzyme A thioesterase PaaI-like protein